jgi:hypothetical protein
VARAKYGQIERNGIDLICYFNWRDCLIVPPIEVNIMDVGFRSLSVVSNRYCEVVYASADSPPFLKDHAGKSVEHVEAGERLIATVSSGLR